MTAVRPTKTRRTREVSFLHPIAEDTSEWRAEVTLASRVVLTDLRRLPVQAIAPEAPVFVRGDGRAWEPMSVVRSWRRALRAAGVRYRVPEMLRHTLCSTLLSRNAPPLYVQKVGGWKSANVVLRVCGRWVEQAEANAQAHPHPAAPRAHPAPREATASAG